MITKAENTGEACLPLVSRRKLYITKFSHSFVCEIDRCSEHDFMYLFMVYLIGGMQYTGHSRIGGQFRHQHF